MEPHEFFRIALERLPTLDWPTLKNLRLVSRRLNQMVTTLVVQRDLLTLQFQWDSGRRQYFENLDLPPTKNVKTRSLKSFIQILMDPPKPPDSLFPCSAFIFKDGDLQHPHVLTLFHYLGRQIKNLRISWSPVHPSGAAFTSQQTLVTLLTVHCPNVESLALGHLPWTWVTPSSPFCLPKLKILTCDHHPSSKESQIDHINHPPPSTALSMLDRGVGDAPNLEKIYNFKANSIHWFQDRVHLVKSFDLYPPLISFRPLMTFATAQPQLEMMSIFCQRGMGGFMMDQAEAAIRGLNLILESSQRSLKIIKMTALSHLNVPGIEENIRIPPLVNLRELALYRSKLDSGKGPHPIFHSVDPGWPEICQNLEIVNVFLWTDKNEDIQKFFDFHQETGSPQIVFPTVKTLRLNGYCSMEWAKFLHLMLPGVKKIEMISEDRKGWEHLRLLVKNIAQNFPDLEHLSFLGCGQWSLTKAGFDTALTGISKKYLENPLENLAIMNQSRGILDLQNLKTLKILISNETFDWSRDEGRRDGPVFNLISSLSGIYAFDQMQPRLKVIIATNQSCAATAKRLNAALKPLDRWVTVVHETMQKFDDLGYVSHHA